MPVTPTVSMCPFRSRERPPPVPGTLAMTLILFGRGSSSSTLAPAFLSHSAIYAAILASPAPPGTSSGFTESMETRASIRSRISCDRVVMFLFDSVYTVRRLTLSTSRQEVQKQAYKSCSIVYDLRGGGKGNLSFRKGDRFE